MCQFPATFHSFGKGPQARHWSASASLWASFCSFLLPKCCSVFFPGVLFSIHSLIEAMPCHPATAQGPLDWPSKTNGHLRPIPLVYSLRLRDQGDAKQKGFWNNCPSLLQCKNAELDKTMSHLCTLPSFPCLYPLSLNHSSPRMAESPFTSAHSVYILKKTVFWPIFFLFVLKSPCKIFL